MTTYQQVTDALSDSIKLFDPQFECDINLFDYQPRTLTPPAAIIKPQNHKTVNYEVSQGFSTTAEWYFLVVMVIGQVSEQDAQRQAGCYVSPGSPFITAINSTTFPTGGWAKVQTSAVSQMSVDTRDGGSALYTYAEFRVYVFA